MFFVLDETIQSCEILIFSETIFRSDEYVYNNADKVIVHRK